MKTRMGWVSTVAIGATVVAVMCLLSTSTQAQSATEALYRTKCASCHGVDGKGQTPVGKALKVRDFVSPDVQKEKDEGLADIIAKGKNKMPGFAKSLKPEQIKDLVAYIRSLCKK